MDTVECYSRHMSTMHEHEWRRWTVQSRDLVIIFTWHKVVVRYEVDSLIPRFVSANCVNEYTHYMRHG